MSQQDHDDLTVLVIAVRGEIRNPLLLSKLRQTEIFSRIHVIESETPGTLLPTFVSDQVQKSSYLLSRHISPTEIAIKASHEKAYKYAFENHLREVLILEDDVEIDDLERFKRACLSFSLPNAPTIVTLYSPNWSIWIRNGRALRSIIPPASAVAYRINWSAVRVALEQPSYGVADWPSWSTKISFYLVEKTGITHPPGDSYVEVGRENSIGKRSKKFAVMYKVLRKPSTQLFYFSIWVPFVWRGTVLVARILKFRGPNDNRAFIFPKS